MWNFRNERLFAVKLIRNDDLLPLPRLYSFLLEETAGIRFQPLLPGLSFPCTGTTRSRPSSALTEQGLPQCLKANPSTRSLYLCCLLATCNAFGQPSKSP